MIRRISGIFGSAALVASSGLREMNSYQDTTARNNGADLRPTYGAYVPQRRGSQLEA